VTTISLTEAKARLSEIADEVDRTHDRVHVTKNGKDYVVLLAAEDLESMEATIELLADQGAIDRIRKAEQDVAAGQTTSLLEMQALMDRRRILEGKNSRTRN
jgi:antitoxin YefM